MAFTKLSLLMSCLGLLAIFSQLRTALSVAVPDAARSGVISLNMTEFANKIMAYPDIPEEIKLNITQSLAADNVQTHITCDVPYKFANGVEVDRAQMYYENKSIAGLLWIYLGPGPSHCKQLACEGDDNLGAEILTCNDDPQRGLLYYGFAYAVFIKEIQDQCKRGDKVRGQLFNSGRTPTGRWVNYNVIIKDVSPGTTCNKKMYDPCIGTVGGHLPDTCPHGNHRV